MVITAHGRKAYSTRNNAQYLTSPQNDDQASEHRAQYKITGMSNRLGKFSKLNGPGSMFLHCLHLFRRLKDMHN